MDAGLSDLLNYAPTFTEKPPVQITHIINEETSVAGDDLSIEYKTQLPEMEDDKQALAEVLIYHKTLGQVKWTNKTGVILKDPK
jgi:hypothetical protein